MQRKTLDRIADGLAWKAAEAAVRVGRRARRELVRRRRAARNTEAAALAALRSALAGRANALDADQLLAGLQLALVSDALELAGVVAEPMLERLPASGDSLRRAALPPLLSWLLAIGEGERARVVADAHRIDLESTDDGATLLDLVGCGGPRLVLPGGGPNLATIGRLLRAGELEPARVDALLLAAPWRLLAMPQLHLLMFMGDRRRGAPAAGVAALNRFLRSQSLPACRLRADSGNLLGDIAWDARPAAADGPMVSVIIAAHQAGETIGYAVESILAQTHRNLEVLIGDDAGSDATIRILADRHGGDRRVRLFASAANQGAYSVRNQLAARARGELLAFHDADDLALPDRIETQVRRLRETSAMASYASWVRVTPSGDFIFFRDQSAVRLARASLLIGRDRFHALGGFRPARFGADLELHSRLRQELGEAAVAIDRRPLVLGLWSPASITRQRGTEALEDGYRAPSRRLYSDLVFRVHHLGAPESELVDALRATGNLAEPAELDELTARPADSATP